MSSTTASLVEAVPDMWTAAVDHQFMVGMRAHTVTRPQFETWLLQDYLYVKAFARFIGYVLSIANDAHLVVIIGGVAALKDELAWFERELRVRGIAFEHATLLPATGDYIAQLQAWCEETDFAVLACVLWAIEAVYHTAWQSCLGAEAQYQECVQRWGSAAFGEYVVALREIADTELSGCSEVRAEQCRQAIHTVLKLEVRFWDMAVMPEPK